jgi:hypothetical protein
MKIATLRFFVVLLLGVAALLAGCEAIVMTTINTANRISDGKEAARQGEIAVLLTKRYQAMADAGNPKGLYYMAIVYAVHHQNDPDRGVYEVKRRYEEAISKGSNDAKVALGRMLIEGDTHPFIIDRA